jgi:hypothetical protein
MCGNPGQICKHVLWADAWQVKKAYCGGAGKLLALERSSGFEAPCKASWWAFDLCTLGLIELTHCFYVAAYKAVVTLMPSLDMLRAGVRLVPRFG